jgi:hypothetical protein
VVTPSGGFSSSFIASLSKRGFTVQTHGMKRLRRRSAFLRIVVLTGLVFSVDAADDELPVIRRSFAEVNEPVPPFPLEHDRIRFRPRPGEAITWIGGTEVVDLDRYGFLETALHLAYPNLGLHWRNLAWQGDTVYKQARPLYFYTKAGDTQTGSIPDHRERTEPGIVFIAFGKMESLEGPERLPDFIAAYAKLIDDLLPLTKRIVLVGPTPFFYSGPSPALSEERNIVLSSYFEAIKKLAAERNLLFILSDAEWNAGMSDNGVHLNETGHRVFAEAISSKFGAGRYRGDSPSLHDAIERKNRLWQQYYRPSNWAFLFGDRQHVPASRDVEKREERWFVREIDSLPGLIAEAEAEIHRYAREAVNTAPLK